MGSCRIKFVDSMESFHSLEGEWRTLLQNSYSDSLFLTWEWLYTWSEVFLGSDRKLFILMIYRNNELLGLAPWYLNTVRYGPFTMRKIEFIGSPEASSDYLDVIAAKGKEEKVASAIYDYLLNDVSSQWDILHLRDFPANSLQMVRLLKFLESNGKYVEIGNGSYCPVIDLPLNKDAFPDQISANRRQKYNRDFKILTKDGDIRHLSLRYKNEKADLSGIRKLYEKRWIGNYDSLFDFLERYIERTREQETAQTDLLFKGDSLVAAIIHFIYKEVIFNYLISVNTEFNKSISLGNLFIGMCVQKAIENKLVKYDFLKGDESYKFHWANNGNRLLNVVYYNNNLAPLLSMSRKKLKNVGKIVLR